MSDPVAEMPGSIYSAVRAVLARNALGGRSHHRRQPSFQIGRLVSKAQPSFSDAIAAVRRLVEHAEFINVPARPASRGNSDRPLAKTH
jgi:hypothetical protein